MHKLIKRAQEFFRNIKQADRVAVMHHSDTDGICSGVLAAKIVERVRNKRIDLRVTPGRSLVIINKAMLKLLKKSQVNKLIIVDCCVDQFPETVREAESFAELLVIDHHKTYSDLNSKRTTFLKPDLVNPGEDGAKYCVSKFLYDLSPVDLSDADWISAIGVIADMNHHRWEEFVRAVFEKHNLKLGKDIYKTTLGKLANYINFATIMDEDEAVFWKVFSAQSPTSLLSLTREYAIVEKEADYWVKNYKKLAEFHPAQELIFYEIEPKKHPIKSLVIRRISELHPNMSVIATQVRGAEVSISARRQDYKVAMNDLLEKATAGLPHAAGGGHIPAAGGVVRPEDLPEFKRRIVKLLTSVFS